jgi:hypothetical protein
MAKPEVMKLVDGSVRVDTVRGDKKIYKTIHGDTLVSSC